MGRLKKLESERKSKRFTCKLMAEKLGVSKPFYWQIENQQRRLSYAMAVKIANILDTKPDDLFYDEFE